MACSWRDEITTLLRERGAKIVRTTRHEVWRLPDGRAWTVPTTPKNEVHWKTNLCDLKRFLGISKAAHRTGANREKRGQRRKTIPGTYARNVVMPKTFQEKLVDALAERAIVNGVKERLGVLPRLSEIDWAWDEAYGLTNERNG